MPSLGIWRAHIGVGTETAYGTALAAPWAYIPALSYDDFSDDQGIVLDDAARAVPTKVLAAYSGMRQGKWGATFPYYPNQVGRFFAKLMGTDSIGSSSAGGWQHSFLTNSSATPSSDTVFVFTGSSGFESRFAGFQYTNADFKFSRATGMATLKVAGIGFSPTTTLAELAPTYSADPALRGWQAVFAINGSTRSTLVDFELNVSREAELIFAANNSQNPFAVEVGTLDAKGKLSLYASTEEPYIDYRANTQQQLDLVLVDTLGGTTMNRVELQGQKMVFTKVTPNMGGKTLRWDCEYQLIHNSSVGGDSGPFSVFTTVATSSSYLS